MSEVKMKMMDGNEAAASVAHRMNEVCVIYPITPSSPMGEWADAWSAAKQKNLWGVVPEVQEMQSEAGAAGACHGSIQTAFPELRERRSLKQVLPALATVLFRPVP